MVAPLDWGLGHSTRCIPLINHLKKNGCEIFIAGDENSTRLLQSEFPEQKFIALKGYGVQYSYSKRLLAFKILCQLPKIWKTIKEEHKWLLKTVEQYKINFVLSDNRFGLWHPSVKSVFITHQLQIKGHTKWLERILLNLNYQHINRFSECWIPDFEGRENLAGQLSHPGKLPHVAVKYIGPLSRFTANEKLLPIYKICIVISGPEPQRSVFEKIILKELERFEEPALLVRGLPSNSEALPNFKHIIIKNHLPAKALQLAFMQSEFIISRAGYTTVMDVVKLQKKAIMVPTPGQTEQEYLGGHLMKQALCLSIPQQDFSLQKALHIAQQFNYKMPVLDMEIYQSVIDQTLALLRAKSTS